MSFNPEKITFFAKTDARGKQIPFGIKAKDRQRHMYVVGKTGMGKSTLLENMAAQDIQNGEGMAFIDPHGSAAETLLDYVPEHRLNDVVYFAPFDLANPVSFNVMEDVGPDKRHLVVSGLMSTFKKIWVDAWSARMEYILTNALLALIEYPDTTLLSVNRLFSDKAYRKQVVDYIKDPAVKAFWTEEFANYTDRFAAEALPAIQNKIGQFTGNPLIRNIIGQPHSSFDIRKIMDEKKILIMNLSKGLVGETNANLLGSMLTTRIYLAAMSRADLPVEQMRTMPNFYFYVDEFQSFANATFANILSEARKYHLNLIIAHQYIEQMEEDVRNAVFGNVGTTIAFRVGPFDAEVLETVFSPRFLATDLVNLGFAQIYLTLMIDGIGSQPFSAITLPPVERPHLSCKQMVIAASRQNYARPREAVEQLVTDLHTPVKVVTLPVPKKNPGAPIAAATPVAQKPYTPASTQTIAKAQVEQKGESQPNETRKEATRAVEPTPQQERNATEAQKRIEGRAHKEKKPEPEVRQRPTPPVRSALDLRAVLTKISEVEHTKKSNSVPKEGQSKAPSKDGTAAVSLRGALAEALKQVAPNPQPQPQPQPQQEDSAVMKVETPTSVPAPTPVVAIESTSASAATIAEAARAELARLTDEAEAAFRTLEATPTEPIQPPPPSASENDDPLAAKKIERLFKQAGHERSPFAS